MEYFTFFYISERGKENNTANKYSIMWLKQKGSGLAECNEGFCFFGVFFFFFCTDLLLFATSAHILVVCLGFAIGSKWCDFRV